MASRSKCRGVISGLQRKHGAHDDQRCRDHGDAGEQRADQEGDGQQRVVPSRLHRAGEHHGGAGLQRQHEDEAETAMAR